MESKIDVADANGAGDKEKKEKMKYWPRKRESSDGKKTQKNGITNTLFKKKISPPGNPLGNKRMAVPDELLPDFCRRIGAKGTRKRMPTINAFVKDHPEVSIRQVTFKFADITPRFLKLFILKPEKPKGKG